MTEPRRRGRPVGSTDSRPRVESKRIPVTVRLRPDQINKLKASGKPVSEAVHDLIDNSPRI